MSATGARRRAVRALRRPCPAQNPETRRSMLDQRARQCVPLLSRSDALEGLGGFPPLLLPDVPGVCHCAGGGPHGAARLDLITLSTPHSETTESRLDPVRQRSF